MRHTSVRCMNLDSLPRHPYCQRNRTLETDLLQSPSPPANRDCRRHPFVCRHPPRSTTTHSLRTETSVRFSTTTSPTLQPVRGNCLVKQATGRAQNIRSINSHANEKTSWDMIVTLVTRRQAKYTTSLLLQVPNSIHGVHFAGP